MFIKKYLKELYLEVMEVFAIKEVKRAEQSISFYSTRLVLWHYTKNNLKLGNFWNS